MSDVVLLGLGQQIREFGVGYVWWWLVAFLQSKLSLSHTWGEGVFGGCDDDRRERGERERERGESTSCHTYSTVFAKFLLYQLSKHFTGDESRKFAGRASLRQ